jgi:hypothetical protein
MRLLCGVVFSTTLALVLVDSLFLLTLPWFCKIASVTYTCATDVASLKLESPPVLVTNKNPFLLIGNSTRVVNNRSEGEEEAKYNR